MHDLLLAATVIIITLIPVTLTLFASDEKSATVYRSAPRSFSGTMIVFSLVGTIIGGAMFVAVGQIGFEAGVVGFILGLVYLMAFVAFGLNAGPVVQLMEKEGKETLVELIEEKYTSRSACLFSAVNAFMYVFLLASQFVISWTFFQFFRAQGVDTMALYAILLVALGTVIAYSWIGGIKKDIRTDIIQVGIVAASTSLILYWIFTTSTPSSVFENLPDEHLTGTGYGILYTVALFLFIGPLIFVRPDIWQRAVALRESKRTVLVFSTAGVISLIAFLIFTYLGMWARIYTPESDASNATLDAIWSLSNQYGEFALAVVLGGIFAAVLSSADTLINNSAVHAEQIIGVMRSGETKDKEQRRQLQYMSLASIVLAGTLALGVRDVVDLISASFSVLLVFIPHVIGLFRRRPVDEVAAFWGALIGLALLIAALVISDKPKEAFVPAVLGAWLLFGVIWAFRRAWEKFAG